MARKASPTEELLVLLNGELMGRIQRAPQGRLRFRYESAYMASGPGIPLSLSMPLLEQEYGHEAIHAFLWGLLPDNEQVLQRWAARFQASPGSAFGLLRHVGEDCAGAVQLVSEDNLARAQTGGRVRLTEADIAGRLRDLRRDPGLTRSAQDQGQFSLPGAQAKTALQFRSGQWYLPRGREPTTHILKVPRPELAGHIENEHFCLTLAGMAGLPVARSTIQRFQDQTAIVVERYDRHMQNRRLIRIHQEDACQALAVHPAKKYEAEGGPGVLAIMNLLNQSSRPVEDRKRFMAALAFNYVILGTDAHARNYSLLLGAHGQIRLAPFYDIASLLPYGRRRRDEKFAMRIGGHYRDHELQPRHFEALARQCGYPAGELRGQILNYAEELPEYADVTLVEQALVGMSTEVLRQLTAALQSRCARLQRLFGAR